MLLAHTDSKPHATEQLHIDICFARHRIAYDVVSDLLGRFIHGRYPVRLWRREEDFTSASPIFDISTDNKFLYSGLKFLLFLHALIGRALISYLDTGAAN